MQLKFMEMALKEAKKAFDKDEVPIGAVIVSSGKVVAKAHNQTQTKKLATAHAEILAIEKASKKYPSWRIENAEMYITLEPCAMCAGAIANARINKVYFGAYEEKSGCAVSLYPVLTKSGLNHTVEVEGGILEKECSSLIKEYFKLKRQKKQGE